MSWQIKKASSVKGTLRLFSHLNTVPKIHPFPHFLIFLYIMLYLRLNIKNFRIFKKDTAENIGKWLYFCAHHEMRAWICMLKFIKHNYFEIDNTYLKLNESWSKILINYYFWKILDFFAKFARAKICVQI